MIDFGFIFKQSPNNWSPPLEGTWANAFALTGLTTPTGPSGTNGFSTKILEIAKNFTNLCATTYPITSNRLSKQKVEKVKLGVGWVGLKIKLRMTVGVMSVVYIVANMTSLQQHVTITKLFRVKPIL